MTITSSKLTLFSLFPIFDFKLLISLSFKPNWYFKTAFSSINLFKSLFFDWLFWKAPITLFDFDNSSLTLEFSFFRFSISFLYWSHFFLYFSISSFNIRFSFVSFWLFWFKASFNLFISNSNFLFFCISASSFVSRFLIWFDVWALIWLICILLELFIGALTWLFCLKFGIKSINDLDLY